MQHTYLTQIRVEVSDKLWKCPKLACILSYPETQSILNKNGLVANSKIFLGTRNYQKLQIETIDRPYLYYLHIERMSSDDWQTVKKKHNKKDKDQNENFGETHKSTTEELKQNQLKNLENLSAKNFYYGNPSTYLVRGIIHLYKQNIPFSKTEAATLQKVLPDMVCILAIPIQYSTHRFLKFLSPFLQSMSYVRIIRDDSPAYYMALIKFGTSLQATQFYDSLNGVPFAHNLEHRKGGKLINRHVNEPVHSSNLNLSVMSEPKPCNISSDSLSSAITTNTGELTSPQNNKTDTGDLSNNPNDGICHIVFVSSIECEQAEDFFPFPPPGTTELPKCIVCMERMEESVEGVLTVLCNHSFHTQCLSQWKDSTCPVCRFSQTGAELQPKIRDGAGAFGLHNRMRSSLDSLAEDRFTAIGDKGVADGEDKQGIEKLESHDNRAADEEEMEENECMEETCQSHLNLWICLICGNIGCGRYLGRHAVKHFEATHHTYAMELETGRVWDYAGDNYVHRLIQNKADGKLVEVVRPISRRYYNALSSPNLATTVNRDHHHHHHRASGQRNGDNSTTGNCHLSEFSPLKQRSVHRRAKIRCSRGIKDHDWSDGLKADGNTYIDSTSWGDPQRCYCDIDDAAVIEGIAKLDAIECHEATINDDGNIAHPLIGTTNESTENTENITLANESEQQLTSMITLDLSTDKYLCDMCGKFRFLEEDDIGDNTSTREGDSPSVKSITSSPDSEENFQRYQENNNIILYDEDEKLDSISLEYSYLMSQQLASQRAHFKSEIAKIEDEYIAEMAALHEQNALVRLETEKCRQDAAELRRDKERLEKRCAVLSAKFETVLRELREEKELNASLGRNQEVLRSKMQALEEQLTQSRREKDAELTELRDQLRDVMFHFNAQTQLSSATTSTNTNLTSQEIQEGTLIVPPPPSSSTSTSHHRRKAKIKKK